MSVPGVPWRVSDAGYPGNPTVVGADGQDVCVVSMRGSHPLTRDAETDRVAAVIAAAPGLIDALRAVWRHLPDGDPLREVAFAALEPFGGVPPV